MKTRAERLDGDLDLLRAVFTEISRLAAEVTHLDAGLSRAASSTRQLTHEVRFILHMR